MSRRKGGMLKPNLGLKSGGLVSRLADHALEDIEGSPSHTPTAETIVPVSNSSKPAGPTVKTLKGPAVEWSSSEDEDEDQNEVVEQEEVNEVEEDDVSMPVLELEPAPEEKSAQESLQQQMPDQQPDQTFQPQTTPQHQMAFSGPPVVEPAAEERPIMSFEDALSMISKKSKAEEEEVPVEEENSQKQQSSRGPPVVSKFSSRLGMADPEASEEQTEGASVPVDPLEMGIDIGVIRGLDEDERIIVIPPPEAEGESNVEASGEESDHTGVESDNSHSATIQGVKVNFKSGAEIPKLVEEEADIAALDKLEHVLTALPPSKPEKSEEISKTEEKLQELPAPPTSKVEGKWAWESGNNDEQPTLKVSLHNSSGDTTSIVSSIPENTEKQKEPEKSMDDIQSMLGSTLLDAFNEEELIQAELNDIREINRREMLKRKPATFPPPAPKEESTKEQITKHVGFAETVESSDGSPKKEPLKAEEKPKPILKSESSIEESLQGTGFNTPRVQRRAIDAEESSSEEEESEEESEEEETDSDSGSDPYEDSIFAGKGELGSKLEKKQIKYVKPGVPVHPNTDARVQFKLRDEDPQMVTALRKEFRECPEVEIACGPLFEEERWDAVIMPMTNSFGWTDVDPEEEFMKAAKADPDLLKAQIELDHGGELLVGRCILLPGKKDRQRRCKFVIAAPIMRVPILIADTVNPFLAMRASIDAIRKYNSTNRDGQRIRSVLIPGMGHGMIGRMPVHRVAHQIRRAYEIRALERDSDEASKDPGKIVKLHMDLANFKLGSKGTASVTVTVTFIL